MTTRLFALLYIASLIHTGQSDCFAGEKDTIPAKDRKKVMIGDKEQPVVINKNGYWISASLINNIAAIILREKVGYHVDIDTVAVGSTRKSYMRIAGCQELCEGGKGKLSGAECKEEGKMIPQLNDKVLCEPGPVVGSAAHLTFETWESYAGGMMPKLQTEVPKYAPIRVAALGAEGVEIYFAGSEVLTAAANKGLFLDWYKSYNISWSNAHTYFDTHDTVTPQPDADACTSSYLKGSYLANYVKWTGDTSDVIWKTVDGKKVPEGRKCTGQTGKQWALSPACKELMKKKDGPKGCIALISYGGWGFHDIAQKAVFFNMPLALGYYNWANYVKAPKASKSLTYWWLPDGVFSSLKPKTLVFPPYDPDETATGKLRSAMGGSVMWKLSSPAVSNDAYLQTYVKLMTMSMQSIMTAVANHDAAGRDANSQDAHYVTACEWLKANRHAWAKWVPDPTACVLAQGLKAGPQWVTDTCAADTTAAGCTAPTTCDWCPTGTSSIEVQQKSRKNYVCESCAKGTFQSKPGATQCDSCATGSFSDKASQSACTWCPLARYQDKGGKDFCETCPTGMVTLEIGSKEKNQCVCLQGTFHDCKGDACELGLDEPKPGFCQPCPPGMECDGPEQQPRAMVIPGKDGGKSYHKLPVLKPGFMAIGKVAYECAGAGNACPGAVMYDPIDKMCANKGSGVACAECPADYRFNGDTCTACKGNPGPAIFMVLLAFTIPAAIVKTFPAEPVGTFTDKTIMRLSHMILTSITFNIIANLLQSTWVFGKLSITWPSQAKDLFAGTGDVFSLQAFSLGCLAMKGDPNGFAVLKTAGLNCAPAVVCLFFGGLYAMSICCGGEGRRFSPDKFRAIASLLAVMASFFMTIVNAAVNSGYAVYRHPDGVSFSLQAFPWILTDAGAAASIQAISAIGLVIWCAGFLTVVAFIIYKLPAKAKSPFFRLSTSTILVAWKPNCPWWIFIVLLQNTGIVLSLSLFTNSDQQWAYNTILILCYLALLTSFKPHYFPLAYYSDLTVSLGKVLMLVSGNLKVVNTGGRILNLILAGGTYGTACLIFMFSLGLQIRLKLTGKTVGITTFMQNLGGRATTKFVCKVDFVKLAPYAQNAVDASFGRRPSFDVDALEEKKNEGDTTEVEV